MEEFINRVKLLIEQIEELSPTVINHGSQVIADTDDYEQMISLLEELSRVTGDQTGVIANKLDRIHAYLNS